MARTRGRSAADTRKLLLTAAGKLLRTQGTSVTLDQVAGEAGVSKGGLLYHFASKDELLIALAQELLDEFHVLVAAMSDPADLAPGAYTRAYIRAMFTPQPDDTSLVESMVLVGQLITIPAVAQVAREDADAIEAKLREDGLPELVSLLVVAAADGANSAPIWGGTPRPEAELEALKDHLIGLTLHG